MKKTHTLRGLATLNFFADDHNAAKEWYTTLLGFPPCFERPGYIEFRISDYPHELGIIDSRFCACRKPTARLVELSYTGMSMTFREWWTD